MQRLLLAYGAPAAASYVVDAADFVSSGDRMTASTNFGAADSKLISFAFMVRIPTSVAGLQQIASAKTGGGTQILNMNIQDGFFTLEHRDATGNATLVLTTSGSALAPDVWHTIQGSANVTPSAVATLYIDNVDVTSLDVANNLNMGFNAVANYYIGATSTPTNSLNACLAEFWWGPGQYIDFSSATERRKFSTEAGRPVNLGATGSTPTGTAPRILCHLDDAEAVANFATNRTGNGNFTISGTLTTCATSPSD